LPASKRLDFEFPVPKELRESKARIHTIGIEGDDFVIDFIDQNNKVKRIKSHVSGDRQYDIETVRDIVESKLAFFFDDVTANYLTGKLADVIDKLYTTKAGNYAISKIKKYAAAEDAKLDGQAGLTKEKPTYTVRKFSGVTTTSPNGGLAEAVIIGGNPMFACAINGGTDVVFYEELETQDMKLRPPTKQEYPPDSALEYESEEEFREYIRIANEEDHLYKLYGDVRKFYTKDYFVDTDPKNSTVLALYTITSYFQDKFSTVAYIWLVGDNGSGKNSVLITYSWLGYRVFYMAGASGANICEYLGTIEEGQGTIAEDELGDMDDDPYKKLLYMNGYASGSCVPKILDASSKSREQRFYRSYCQKMSASENLPDIKYSKGVLDREFIIKCVKGFPKYNINMTKKRTRTPEVLRIVNDLQSLRKRLFAYRLAHFYDVIKEVDKLSISGRALELTESALQLFYKYKEDDPEYDKTFKDEILATLSEFLRDRLGRRNVSLEAKLYPIITKMVEEQGETLENDKIFAKVQSELEGKPVPGKEDYAFYVEELGRVVKRNDIHKVLREKFKADPGRLVLPDGTYPRAHVISKQTLESIKASYEDQWDIKFLLEDTSDQPDQPDQALYETREVSEEKQPSQQETELKDTPENPKTEVKTPEKDSEYTSRTPVEPGQPGQPGQSYSIEECINRATRGKDFFTQDDWVFTCLLWPNLQMTVNGAEQTFHQLLLEGKIVELEPGKYRPTEKLSTSDVNE
jgi:hypothetical protein